MGNVEFSLRFPVDDKSVRRQIQHSLALGLPELDGEDLPVLHVIANGPSAAGAEIGGYTLALNGAINLFPKDGPPSMWAACDPQALVADFLNEPSPATTYLIASKCHPKVFEKLQGFDVRLWHINDQPIPNVRRVPCAVSVTLCALMLMQRLGWRRFEVWGWDCCFGPTGAHHAAGAGKLDVPTVEVAVGPDRRFLTSPTWAAEVQDAINILPVLEWCGAEITIHGDGMVRAVRDELKAAA